MEFFLLQSLEVPHLIDEALPVLQSHLSFKTLFLVGSGRVICVVCCGLPEGTESYYRGEGGIIGVR